MRLGTTSYPSVVIQDSLIWFIYKFNLFALFFAILSFDADAVDGDWSPSGNANENQFNLPVGKCKANAKWRWLIFVTMSGWIPGIRPLRGKTETRPWLLHTSQKVVSFALTTWSSPCRAGKLAGKMQADEQLPGKIREKDFFCELFLQLLHIITWKEN